MPLILPYSGLLKAKPSGDSTNLIRSPRDFSTWGGAASISQDQDGYDGTPNAATTMTDSDGVLFSNRSEFTHTVDGSLPVLFSVYVKKTVGAQTHFPAMTMAFTTPSAFIYCTMDPTNGTTGVPSGVTGPTSSGAVDETDFWHFWMSITPPSSQTNVNCLIYPALTATLNGARNGASTGSNVFDQVALRDNTSSL